MEVIVPDSVDCEGNAAESGGGGVAFNDDGSERPLSEEELLDHLYFTAKIRSNPYPPPSSVEGFFSIYKKMGDLHIPVFVLY